MLVNTVLYRKLRNTDIYLNYSVPGFTECMYIKTVYYSTRHIWNKCKQQAWCPGVDVVFQYTCMKTLTAPYQVQ